MRAILTTAAAGMLLLSTGGRAAELENFRAGTVADLAALCGASPASAYYEEAMQFCYGYISGAAQFHTAVVSAGALKPLACPAEDAMRDQFARFFVNWARTSATPDQLREPPVEGMARAAAARWPCNRDGS
jgi:Rap1a immunity proteins